MQHTRMSCSVNGAKLMGNVSSVIKLQCRFEQARQAKWHAGSQKCERDVVTTRCVTCSRTGLPNCMAFSIWRSRSGMAKFRTRSPFCASIFLTHLLACPCTVR